VAAGDPQGLMSFPGIRQILSGSFSLQHGISPGIASITIAPQTNFTGLDGPLAITYGNTVLTFPGCRLSENSFEYDDSGAVWRLGIMDRRWSWKYGYVRGSYNLRWPNGQLNTTTEQTVPQLMAMCLDALQEQTYDLSDVPTLARPEVHWDYDGAAQALADLADQVGCRVVLGLDNKVRVQRMGNGIPLPATGNLMQASNSINPPTVPDAILFVAGPSRFEPNILLEAVGLDLDGVIRPVNQLTYRPLGGWDSIDPWYMGGVSETTKARILAVQTVWRWYRISQAPLGIDGQPLKIPGYDQVILDRKQLLPLEDGGVQTYIDNTEIVVQAQGGPQLVPVPKNRLPLIWGLFSKRSSDYSLNVTIFADQKVGKTVVPSWTNPLAEYKGSFQIDSAEGIVKFADPVFIYLPGPGGVGFTISSASLSLRIACPIRDAAGKAPQRYTQVLQLAPPFSRGGAEIVSHPEVQAAYWAELSGGDNGVKELQSNITSSVLPQVPPVQDEATYYLNATLAKYQTPQPQQGLYAGIVAISPDGAIQVVSWNVGQGGATTRAARNSEMALAVIPFRERRMLERLNDQRQQGLRAQQEVVRAMQIGLAQVRNAQRLG
jgi:hypothetical protein